MRCKLVNKVIKNNYVRELLTERGVENPQNIISPSESVLNNPSFLENIEEGAMLLKQVCDNKGKILLVVDSDCDGFTSSSIMYLYLKEIYPDLSIEYIIHSGKQHGLEDHMDFLLSNDPYDLIILPDSSSNDLIYHDELGQYGTKFLVLDHHIVEKELSSFAIVINNQTSPKYTNKELTGAGVVFQFCKYFDSKFNYNFANQFIDLAALGICGDMGSMLSEENQYFIRTGFKNINNYFFQQLVKKQAYSMGNVVNATTVAFYIVPLINAMIRVGTDEEKIRMFEAFIDGKKQIPSRKRGSNGALEEIAIESIRECVNAKAKQTRIKDAAIERIEYKIYKENLLDNKILLIRLDDTDDFPSELNGSTILAR